MGSKALKKALILWLRDDRALMAELDAIEIKEPTQKNITSLSIVGCQSSDWGTSTRKGLEVRLVLKLTAPRAHNESIGDLVTLIERRVGRFPGFHLGIHCLSAQFMRARSEIRDDQYRAFYFEYRFRLLNLLDAESETERAR